MDVDAVSSLLLIVAVTVFMVVSGVIDAGVSRPS